MKKEHGITVLILFTLWFLSSIAVGNDVLIPCPLDVFKRVLDLGLSSTTFIVIAYSLFRLIKGFLLSLGCALVLSILANKSIVIKNLFEPLHILSKSIPNISYIILVLIWFGSERSVSIICFLILFPIFYSNFLFTLENESQDLKDVEKIYPESFFEVIRVKTLPMLMLSILNSSKMAMGLGLKVSIMAEILGQVQIGIGRQLSIARLNLDTTGLFAWTVLIILISFIIDHIFDQFINRKKKEG